MERQRAIPLKVQFMNAFELSYNGEKLNIVQDSTAKSSQLLAILLLYAKDGVSRDKLISWLYPNGDADSANSLKALVFRLRRRLQASGLPDCEYVLIQDGTYRFTGALPIVSDIAELYALNKKAEVTADPDAQAEVLARLCQSYRGDMLPSLATELWVVLENAALADVVIAAAKKLCAYYDDKRDYERAYQLNRRMSEFMPFDEKWHIGRINCLVSLGRFQQATDEYETITGMLFDELGLYPSEHLLECARAISKNILLPVAAATDVSSSLAEAQGSGAYYCSYPNFVDSYRVLRHIMERTGTESSLLLCSVVDGGDQAVTDKELLSQGVHGLTLALNKTLRKSDMYTRYSASQMLVLLWDCTQERSAICIERIKSAMAAIMGDGSKIVSVAFAALSGAEPPLPISANKTDKKWGKKK